MSLFAAASLLAQTAEPAPGDAGVAVLIVLLILLVFPLFFIGMWVMVSLFIGLIGGWRTLAGHYRAAQPFRGRTRSWQTGSLDGFGRYRGSLKVGADPSGLSVATVFLFRPGHPPLFFAWPEVTVSRGKELFWSYLEFRFARASVALRLPSALENDLSQAAGAAWPGIREAA